MTKYDPELRMKFDESTPKKAKWSLGGSVSLNSRSMSYKSSPLKMSI